jgi:hypothetical protein
MTELKPTAALFKDFAAISANDWPAFLPRSKRMIITCDINGTLTKGDPFNMQLFSYLLEMRAKGHEVILCSHDANGNNRIVQRMASLAQVSISAKTLYPKSWAEDVYVCDKADLLEDLDGVQVSIAFDDEAPSYLPHAPILHVDLSKGHTDYDALPRSLAELRDLQQQTLTPEILKFNKE